jgi:hypothetical protein
MIFTVTRVQDESMNNSRTNEMSRRSLLLTSGMAAAAAAAPDALPYAPAATAPMGGIERKFVLANGLRNTVIDGTPGFVLKVRLPDYRSLPLSCITGVELAVDGTTVDTQQITFNLNGYRHKFADLPSLSKVDWWVLDIAELFVPRASPLSAGLHDIDATLIFVVPYATAGAFTLRSWVRRRLTLESA